MTGSLDRAELQAVDKDVQKEGKAQALAESLEMITHYKQSTQVIDLLDRWQTEMKQFNVHTRSHLVHHLRCVNLDHIADRYYSYLTLVLLNMTSCTAIFVCCIGLSTTSSKYLIPHNLRSGLAEVSFLPQVGKLSSKAVYMLCLIPIHQYRIL